MVFWGDGQGQKIPVLNINWCYQLKQKCVYHSLPWFCHSDPDLVLWNLWILNCFQFSSIFGQRRWILKGRRNTLFFLGQIEGRCFLLRKEVLIASFTFCSLSWTPNYNSKTWLLGGQVDYKREAFLKITQVKMPIRQSRLCSEGKILWVPGGPWFPSAFIFKIKPA